MPQLIDLQDGDVRVQSDGKTIRQLRDALDVMEYELGRDNQPIFVADGGNYFLVKAEAYAVD